MTSQSAIRARSCLSRQPIADAALESGRFRVLLRRRQLLADGVPVELGTRAFEILLALLVADGFLVTKGELLRRVWPGIVVAEENPPPLATARGSPPDSQPCSTSSSRLDLSH